MMFVYIFKVLIVCIASRASASKFYVAHAPNSLTVQDAKEPFPLTDIAQINSGLLGYSSEKDLPWSGIQSNSIFSRPKALVILSVPSGDFPSPASNLQYIASYDVTVDSSVNTEDTVNDILRHTWSQPPLIIDYSLHKNVYGVKDSNQELLSDLTTSLDKVKELVNHGDAFVSQMDGGVQSLNVTDNVDLNFIAELQALHEIRNALKTSSQVTDGTPDLIHIHFGAFDDLIAHHGARSTQAQHAHSILANAINQVVSDIVALYKTNVMVEIVTYDEVNVPKMRIARGLQGVPEQDSNNPPVDEPEDSDDNNNNGDPESSDLPPIDRNKLGIVAGNYDRNFPIVFNMALWTMLVLALALLGISYGMWNMDPGRDSIIYRMTSQRIKKD